MYIDHATDGELRPPHLKKRRKARVNWLFLLCVVAPTAIASLYFGLYASDVYISESRFVVRSPEKQSTSPLGLILKGAGFSRAQDDTYAVHDFMLSRDALRVLEDQLGFSIAYGSDDVDVIARFGGLDWDKSFEALHLYYQRRVEVAFDDVSGISTLTVRAFSAEDAWVINQKLLELSEDLLNRLNDRARQDMIRFASAEVAAAEERAKEAALALARYRNEKGVIDPEKQSAIPLQQVAKLQDSLIEAKARLIELTTLSPGNPQIPVLRKRIETLEAEIAAESTKVAGGARSLADKAAEYQRLALELEFADKQLAIAMAALQQAYNEAQRKQLYLERVVQPNLPDVAMEPKRIRSVVATFVLGLIAWGVLTLLVAGIREHRD